MELSTLIAPLVTLASKLKSVNNSSLLSKGNPISALAALDRTLGTVATLGLTIGLFRMLKQLREEYRDHSDKADKDKVGRILLLIQSLIQALLRGVMMGVGRKRIKVDTKPCNDKNVKNSKEKQTISGSCYCNSISFILRAPSHIEAIEYSGKINYPHYVSNTNDFQLISGSRFLSVHYVNICNDEDDESLNEDHFEHNNIVAAHTFCSRCGVHILRAPNAHTNLLEVNTNCLDKFQGVKDNGDSVLSINVKIEKNQDRIRMGKSLALHHPSKQLFLYENGDDDSYRSLSTSMKSENYLCSANKTLQPWISETTYYNKGFDETLISKQSPSSVIKSDDTPTTTTSTHKSGSYISCTINDSESSLDDGLSCDDNNVNSFNIDRSRNDSFSITGWSVASSLQSLTPTSRDAMGASNGIGTKSRPSTMMKDQVKYYMSKHLGSQTRLSCEHSKHSL